ncbi:MAG TPA: tetratricopeptide repeat-containing sensor histidine kinase [Chitinophagaceae bacterium]|nr:tetratricopeptide repeat-containing sensor histidine kinase [Chitinophagaceae bacterium]
MKGYKLFFCVYIIFLSSLCFSQNNYVDSLRLIVSKSRGDTSKVNNLLQLSKAYISSSSQEAIKYGNEALNLSQKLNYKSGKAYALKNIGMVYYNQARYVETIVHWNQSYLLFDSIGDRANEALMLSNLGSVYMNQADYAKALDYFFKSLQISEQSKDMPNIARAMGNIGTAYSNNEFTYDKALGYYLKALTISEELEDKNTMGALLVNIGETYLKRNEDDSALYYFKKSLESYENTENVPYSLNDIGKTYTKKGNYNLAEQYHEKALSFATKLSLQLDIAQSYLGLGNTYYKKREYNLALDAYGKAQSIAGETNLKKELEEAYQGLAITYAAIKDFSSAYKYQTLYTNIKDTLFNLDIAQKVTNAQTHYEIQKKQGQIDILTKDQALQNLEVKRQKFARNTLAASLLFVFAITFILFNLYRKVGRRTLQLKRSLEELKSTQAQLIQSEKMASLGSLTAGIGHEIQNPLNFVNNFSEVNVELLHELEDALLKKLPETDKAEANEIIKDLAQNMEKISHHGKRADAIIKGMLQHSRKNTGQKELTNINALADEYLRLSYHGLHPKDKSFKTDIKTKYDEGLSSVEGKIDINPQDFGRVLLNLYNNAFYSTTEKKEQQGETYEPIVSVSTKKLNDKIEIRVKDNGTGIPQKVLDKIFQPFFTTKPTGQGTGLGLSLSYDIIKAHSGELKVNTKEGEFAEFVITIPTS